MLLFISLVAIDLFPSIIGGGTNETIEASTKVVDAISSDTDSSTKDTLMIFIGIPYFITVALLLVSFVMLIIRSTIAIIRKDIFRSSLIKALRNFTVLYLVTMLGLLAITMISPSTFGLDDNSLSRITPMVISELINALLILIMSQLLNIGKELKEENDLTI